MRSRNMSHIKHKSNKSTSRTSSPKKESSRKESLDATATSVPPTSLKMGRTSISVKSTEISVKVFTVDVWVSGRHHMVEKRYSEFEDLHKQIKKLMKTPEFPPKKVLKWNNKVLEQRRLGLESYLQGVVSYEAVPRDVFEFLEITVEEEGMDLEQTDAYTPMHQAVVTFKDDAYLQDLNRGTLPDIIAEGVTIGLFDNDNTAFPS